VKSGLIGRSHGVDLTDLGLAYVRSYLTSSWDAGSISGGPSGGSIQIRRAERGLDGRRELLAEVLLAGRSAGDARREAVAMALDVLGETERAEAVRASKAGAA